MMSSENPSGADNQQERLITNDWLVGFVDGEGCFSCPVFRNRSMRLGCGKCNPHLSSSKASRVETCWKASVRSSIAGDCLSIIDTTTIGKIYSATTSLASGTCGM